MKYAVIQATTGSFERGQAQKQRKFVDSEAEAVEIAKSLLAFDNNKHKDYLVVEVRSTVRRQPAPVETKYGLDLQVTPETADETA